MTTTNDGGPANPVYAQMSPTSEGLTVRDFFACNAQPTQRELAERLNLRCRFGTGFWPDLEDKDKPPFFDDALAAADPVLVRRAIAELKFEVADSMLAARDRAGRERAHEEGGGA